MSKNRRIRGTNEQRIARGEVQLKPAREFLGDLPSPVLQLQRMLGNRRVAQLIQAKRLTPEGKILGLQPKTTVGAADDQYEQEADRVNDEATRTSENAAFSGQQLAGNEFNALRRMRPGSPFAKRHTDRQAGTLATARDESSPKSSGRRGLLAHGLANVIDGERGPESKRHMHKPTAFWHAQDKTLPSPDVVMRKVKTSSAAVLNAFQALCPSAIFTSGQGGFIAGRGCAGVITSQTTCRCLCYAVTNRTLYSFDVSMASWSKSLTWMHDNSFIRIPFPSVWPGSAPLGSDWLITLPSVSSPGVFGAFDSSDKCTPYPFERLLAHELCGHAVVGRGSEERGDRPAHDDAIQIENDIAQEQGWPTRGSYSNNNQGESYSQESGDPKIVYKLKDGWHYQTCTPPPENAPGQQHPRRRRRRRKGPSIPQQKITNTENVRLVEEPEKWAEDRFLIKKLPKGTTVEVLDKGEGEPFNQTAVEYQWWWVRVEGKEGWVMQVLLDEVMGSP